MRIRALPVLVLLALVAGCATAPKQTRNICAVFDQRDGLFTSWQRVAEKTEHKYGVPVPILMATMYTESGFQPYARPPRTKLFGFIPWTRPSTAYGYSQALDGTWDHYRSATGSWAARRTNFADAIDFIGWYHSQNSQLTGIPLNDAYNLYLAYYSGPKGYMRGDWRSNAELQKTAQRFNNMAVTYQRQLQECN
ncbi:transglycosylase SLT domain-containing protein [Rhizobium mesoamericanum]|uniref:transglycosylase SLT domain-containing protein n=1 Tax=Rhizobium mesoamericanum TaxID=1079800 RepID=UPI000417FE14|nr:transglycosylase SLT domain-containing protein [Rhizobium mesoamericanum]